MSRLATTGSRAPCGRRGVSDGGSSTEATVGDPLTGQPRSLNDLARRRADLKLTVCPSDPIPPGSGTGGVGVGEGGTGDRATNLAP